MFTFSIRDNDYSVFQSLSPGNYQIRFRYAKSVDAVEDYHRYAIDPGVLQEVWAGEIITPLVEFCLVEP